MPPALRIASADGVTSYRQAAACCDRFTCTSPTASAPCRATGSAFSAILYDTEPSPCPVAAEVNEIHATLLETVHAHSRATPIARVPVPPVDSNEEVEGVAAA